MLCESFIIESSLVELFLLFLLFFETFSLSGLSNSLIPFMSLMAYSTDTSCWKITKPKRLFFFVAGSFGILTERKGPACRNSSKRSSSVILSPKFPTKTVQSSLCDMLPKTTAGTFLLLKYYSVQFTLLI